MSDLPPLFGEDHTCPTCRLAYADLGVDRCLALVGESTTALAALLPTLGNERLRYMFWSTCLSLRVLDGHSPIVAVTHNGVLRALLAIATGWDMTGKPPVKLSPATLHRFALSNDGTLAAREWNVPLERPLSAARSAPQPRPPAPSKALP